MKKNEIVILALKLLGIYITVQGLSAFASTFGQNGFRGIGNWSMYLGFFIYLLSGIILLLKAKSLSSNILSIDDETIDEYENIGRFPKGSVANSWYLYFYLRNSRITTYRGTNDTVPTNGFSNSRLFAAKTAANYSAY
jgi:hypothetical protein